MKYFLQKATSHLSLCLILLMLPSVSYAQCLFQSFTLKKRVSSATHALIGNVSTAVSYKDNSGNIYTRHSVEVIAWAKNYSSQTEVQVITEGGIIGNDAQITTPSVNLQKGSRYFLMLNDQYAAPKDQVFALQHPSQMQSVIYGDAQGAMINQDGYYYDAADKKMRTEANLLSEVFLITGLQAKKPDGTLYQSPVLEKPVGRTQAITSFTPNPTYAGTIVTANRLQIKGSGFGASTGKVEFKSADDGGATYVTVIDKETDYVYWADDSIVVKIPTKAGSGTFKINSSIVSSSSLILNYAHLSVSSTFSGFTDTTLQRYYLKDIDGVGGYTFKYNTTSGFSDSTSAKDAFERAISTWRCNTGITWKAEGTTDSVFKSDGVNVVLYDATLPAGVLGRATSRFSASSTGTCKEDSTVWYLREVDIQFAPTPSAGFDWNYTTTTPTLTQYDFETVSLHELGHAHGLGHRNFTDELMYYTLTNGVAIRTPSTFEIDGGKIKMDYSTPPSCFNPGTTKSVLTYSGAGCTVLPLRLISFAGQVNNDRALLNWRTVNEKNTDRFEIERQDVNGRFTARGQVKTKANNNLSGSYNFADDKLMRGANHYRLKMIDKDQAFTYSKVVTLLYLGKHKNLVVYPNPVTAIMYLEAPMKQQVSLVNSVGITVKTIMLNTGKNSLDVTSLPAGNYYLANQMNNQRIKISIIH